MTRNINANLFSPCDTSGSINEIPGAGTNGRFWVVIYVLPRDQLFKGQSVLTHG